MSIAVSRAATLARSSGPLKQSPRLNDVIDPLGRDIGQNSLKGEVVAVNVGNHGKTHGSAPAIGGIAPGRNQQRHMVVRARVGDAEADRHEIEEWRIGQNLSVLLR